MSQKILITSDKCGTCDNLKKVLAQNGALDKYRLVDVDTAEGQALVKGLGLTGVPECAVIEKKGEKNLVRVCTESEWAKVLKGE